jgi:hypothetical protein
MDARITLINELIQEQKILKGKADSLLEKNRWYKEIPPKQSTGIT